MLLILNVKINYVRNLLIRWWRWKIWRRRSWKINNLSCSFYWSTSKWVHSKLNVLLLLWASTAWVVIVWGWSIRWRYIICAYWWIISYHTRGCLSWISALLWISTPTSICIAPNIKSNTSLILMRWWRLWWRCSSWSSNIIISTSWTSNRSIW